jgi:hypothetical protein
MMGGLAVRAHGVPRPTYDVDAVLDIPYDRLLELEFRIYRGTPEQSVDVDVFLLRTAFQESVLARRQLAEVEDIGRVWIVSPEDIILQKLVAGRHRDRGDIEDIRFMSGELDEPYMRRWAEDLGVSKELEQVLATPPI